MEGNTLYDDLVQGLTEAIEYEKGDLDAKITKLSLPDEQ